MVKSQFKISLAFLSACVVLAGYLTVSRFRDSGLEGGRNIASTRGKSFLKELDSHILLKPLEDLQSFSNWVADNPLQMWAEMRESRPIITTHGVPLAKWNRIAARDTGLIKPSKFTKLVVLANKDDVLAILDRPDVFTVRIYGEKMEEVMPGNFMLGMDRDPQKNFAEKAYMRSLMKEDDLRMVAAKAHALALAAVESGKEVVQRDGKKIGRLEVVNKLGRKIPIEMTGVYAGFPGPDEATMYRWSKNTQEDFFRNVGDDPAVHARAVETGKEMEAYIGDLFEKMARNPDKYPDTLMSRMLKFKEKVPTPDLKRLVILTSGMLIGAGETTQAAVVNSVVELLHRRESGELKGAIEAARADDDKRLGQYIWEALRFRPVNLTLPRYAEQDFDLHGFMIPKGSIVLAATQSAMFDDKAKQPVKDPNSFRLDRDPSVYFHLGYGHHRCLGDYISLAQVPQIVKAILLKPNLRLAPGADGEIYKLDGFPERLYVEWDEN